MTPPRPIPSVVALVAILALSSSLACVARPARFTTAPPVRCVPDYAPIAVPSSRAYEEDAYLSDLFVRHALIDALDPSRVPPAGDINSLDEVPCSSWFNPYERTHAATRSLDGPPVEPLRIVEQSPVAGGNGLVIHDARGLRYELRIDPPDRPEMRTSSEKIVSELVRAFGIPTPEVWVIHVLRSDFVTPSEGTVADAQLADLFSLHGVTQAQRVAATRWPPGIDVGPAPAFETRFDDPNDRIAHRDRRTLRALKVLGAWLDLSNLGPRSVRDVYMGEPGKGHLVHFLVGLDSALGAASVVRDVDPPGPRTDRAGGPLRTFLSLGLWPGSDPDLTQQRWPAIGAYSTRVDPIGFAPYPPYPPIQRASAADGYWAAKHIMRITDLQIGAALDAAHLSDPAARSELRRRLAKRRKRVARAWFDQVTPCEVQGVDGRRLRLRDQAVALGLHPANGRRYALRLLDDRGQLVAPPRVVRPQTASFAITLPRALPPNTDRLIVEVRVATRGGELHPPCQVHLLPELPRYRLIGLRH